MRRRSSIKRMRKNEGAQQRRSEKGESKSGKIKEKGDGVWEGKVREWVKRKEEEKQCQKESRDTFGWFTPLHRIQHGVIFFSDSRKHCPPFGQLPKYSYDFF